MEMYMKMEPARKRLPTCDYGQINTPGLYLEVQTGSLLRVPEDAIMPGDDPERKASSRSRPMMRIHEDPFLETSRARMLAADLDYETRPKPRILPRRKEPRVPEKKATAGTPRAGARKPRRSARR